jgi:hypothetical protein
MILILKNNIVPIHGPKVYTIDVANILSSLSSVYKKCTTF